MSGKIVTLSSKSIIVSGLQVREQMDRKHVDDLAELFDEENPTWPDGLPPLVVFHDGKGYFLADGHHRLDAAMQAGCTEIRVDARKGTMEDALRHACGANASHGLKRTNADKRNAVRIAYQLLPGSPCRTIANLCKVGKSFAADVVREIENKQVGMGKNKGQNLSNVSAADTLDNEGSKLSDGKTEDEGERIVDSEPADPSPSESDAEPDDNLITESVAAPRPWLPGEAEYDELNDLLRQVGQLINRLGKSRGGELLRSNCLKLRSETRNGEPVERFYSPHLENLKRELNHWRPHSPLCPICDEIPSQTCNLCLGLPYLTRGAYDRLTDAQRAKLEKVSTNDAA